jgi:hypothetical protein
VKWRWRQNLLSEVNDASKDFEKPDSAKIRMLVSAEESHRHSKSSMIGLY